MMEMGFGLYQEQKMQLTMTPQLRQAIMLLQYSALDLRAYLEEQVRENPLLELEGGMSEGESLQQLHQLEQFRQQAEWEWEEERAWRGADLQFNDRELDPIQLVSTPAGSLTEILLEQLLDYRIRPELVGACHYLIHNLEDSGYLSSSLEELAEAQSEYSLATLNHALQLLQRLDPAGVGARNLPECLLLQTERLGIADPLMVKIIQEHLEAIADHRYQQLAQTLKVSVQEVQQIADLIRRLDPRPGASFTYAEVRFIIPDVIMRWTEQNEILVVPYEEQLPKLTISSHYRKLLHQDQDQEVTQYLKGNLDKALWLIRSIQQRRQTILRVATAIAQHQQDFLQHGKAYLKPLTLREIAEEIEMHESTVSRVTQQKYAQTPHGMLELKEFFVSGVRTADGDGASIHQVKAEIEKLVAAEDRRRPLSDQKLAERLREQGIKISRRTVAKYRDELAIPPSSKRKRFDS